MICGEVLQGIGRWFGDRMVVAGSGEPLLRPVNDNLEWGKRWLGSFRTSLAGAPKDASSLGYYYAEENRRALACFQAQAANRLGGARLARICARYGLDFEKKKTEGSPLYARDVAKIAIGARDVAVEDIEEELGRESSPRAFGDLNAEELSQIRGRLSAALEADCKVPPIAGMLAGCASDWFARIRFDRFVADRERLQLCEPQIPGDLLERSMNVFVDNLAARVIKRDMELGTLVPAPRRADGVMQFYYAAAKLVTGQGMVSYIFLPATSDTHLPPLRCFRGSSFRFGETDSLSTMATDLEKDLGRLAYTSSLPYEPLIQRLFPQVSVEAGHSLGATLVQYRLANMDHIRLAYLCNGPGVPLSEALRFNANMRSHPNRQVQLVIHKATRDPIAKTGEIHLGWRAPENVDIEFLKYHSLACAGHPHVFVWGLEPSAKYGIEGVMRPQLEAECDHRNEPLERIRRLFGAWISRILLLIRDLFRFLFPQYAPRSGLEAGLFENGRFRIRFYN